MTRRRRKRTARRRIRGWGMKDTPRMRGILAATAALCSCYVCGNPRRHWKGKGALTKQERQQAEKDTELMEEAITSLAKRIAEHEGIPVEELPVSRLPLFPSYGISPDCCYDESYGVICVQCGLCGRRFKGGFLIGKSPGERRES